MGGAQAPGKKEALIRCLATGEWPRKPAHPWIAGPGKVGLSHRLSLQAEWQPELALCVLLR